VEILVSIAFVIFVAVIVKAAVSNFSRSTAKGNQAPVEPPLEQPETQEQPVEEKKPALDQPKPTPDGVYLGIPVEDTADVENGLWMPSKLRGRHLYLIGKTRTGKTTLIKNLIIQDMQQGHGLCSIDPHGDCAEELLANVPAERIKDVIYFDPSRTFSPSFNFFRLPFPPYKLTEDVVAVFKMFFGSAWGPRMEHLLRFSVLTLLSDEEPHTLPDLRRLCINADFRAEIAARVKDPAIREFWEHEFPTIEKGAFNPIINKLSAFLIPGSPLLRVFSEKENDLDFSAIMNGEKILIVNLAKGVLGDEPSRLLGGLIVTGIQQAALARADIPPDQRKEFHLFIDEFQNFLTDSVTTILSESAKYKLFLTLAHQTLGQLPKDIERSIFGNIATLISFQISAEDAGTFRREMKATRHRICKDGSPVPLSVAIEDRKRSEEQTLAIKTACLQEYQMKLNELVSDPKAAEQRIYNEMKKSSSNYDPISSNAHKAYERDLRDAKERIPRYKEEIRFSKSKIATLLDPNLTATDFISKFYSYPAVLYKLEEYSYPDVDDFTSMQPRHAFCRMELAQNLTLFRTVASPDPVAGIKGQILHAMRERHAERKKAHAPKPQPHTEEQPAVAVGAEYAHAAEPRQEPPHLRVVKGGRGSTQAPTRKKPSTEEEFDF